MKTKEPKHLVAIYNLGRLFELRARSILGFKPAMVVSHLSPIPLPAWTSNSSQPSCMAPKEPKHLVAKSNLRKLFEFQF